jgi:hypothetical protein
MPIGKTIKYTMDRRQLLKLTGAMGIGVTFLDPEKLYAADPANCEKIKIDDSGSKFEQTQGSIYYWIDGNNFGHRTNVKSRANISVFITLKQKDSAFVESVVLIDETGKVLGARYLDASMKMVRGGFPPYVRFENIEINPKKVYKVIYAVKDGFQTSLYVTSLSPKELPTGRTASENSALNESINWLPNKMRTDFSYFLVEGPNTPSKTPGLFTTPFQFYTDAGLDNHCSRAVIKEIGSDGNFKINVEFMHDDSRLPNGTYDPNSTHFMRYFVIMDPVGRLLGFHKRDASDINGKSSATNLVVQGSHVEIMPLEKDTRTCWDPVAKVQTNKTKVDFYNIKDPNRPAEDNIQIADIRDCPYIQIYTEDSYDAMARSIIRLR